MSLKTALLQAKAEVDEGCRHISNALLILALEDQAGPGIMSKATISGVLTGLKSHVELVAQAMQDLANNPQLLPDVAAQEGPGDQQQTEAGG